MYTYACIKEAIIGRSLSHTDNNNRVLPILASSIQTDVYKILCLSEMSLPGADIFPDFIFLPSSHERSADPIPRVFEVTLQLQNQELWWMVMSNSDAKYDCYHH